MTDPAARRLQSVLPERYEIQRMLKRGGMGVLYVARERHPNRQVVIKVLDPDLTVRLGRERFVREIDMVSSLIHPHVVPIYAAGKAGEYLYYVMPYVDGEDLSERLARDTTLPIGMSLRIAYEVADTLAYAHERNIIHRDIKPANILLHEGHAMVTDFGVARAISEAEQEPITEVGVTLGTPAYMSPEQISAESKIDGRTDVYSLGCMLFEMLTGKPPFRGKDARDTLMHHMMDTPPSVSKQRPEVSSEVAQLIEKALAKDPDDRFQTARDFADALQASGASHTSWSEAIALPGGLRRKRNHRIAIGIAVVFTLAVAAALLRPGAGPLTLASTALPPWRDSIAILPATNNTTEPSHEREAVRIAEQVQNEMARIPGIKVIELPSAEIYHDSGWSARMLARALEVRYVLRGTIDAGDAGAELHMRLVDGHSDALVWGDNLPLDASTTVQAILTATLDALGYAPPNDISLDPTRLADGRWEAHLGTHTLARRTATGVIEAIDHFTTAIVQDSTYADAYASLAQALALSLTYRYDIGLDGYVVAATALAHAEHALALDANLASGYAARGYLGAIAGAPTAQVETDFDVAGRLKPNGASIASWKARMLARSGQFDQALSWRERAVRLDPRSVGRHNGVALAALATGSLDRVLRATETASSIEPDLVFPRMLTALAFLLSGRPADCLAMNIGPHVVLHATCLLEQGDTARAEALVRTAVARFQGGTTAYPDYTPELQAGDLAGYWAWRGDGERALEWLREAFEHSPAAIERTVLFSALFAKVRDERFLSQFDRLERDAWRRVKSERPSR